VSAFIYTKEVVCIAFYPCFLVYWMFIFLLSHSSRIFVTYYHHCLFI